MCVLSVSGTAAVINPKYTTDTATTTSRAIVAPVGSAPKDINQSERSDVDKDMRKIVAVKDVAQSLPINDKMLPTPMTVVDVENETETASLKVNKETGCTMVHIPYRKSSTFDMHTCKKCSTCK